MEKNINSKALTNELVVKVNTAAKTQAFKLKMKEQVAKYIDRNSEILYAFAPTKQLVFSELDKQALFDASGITREEVREAIAKSTYIYKGVVISTDPFNILTALFIREYVIMKDEAMVDLLLLNLTFKLYTSKYSRQFPYDPNENTMRAAINEMSNRYKIKQMGNVFDTIRDLAKVCLENYRGDLIKGTDKDISDFVNGLDSRLGGFFRYLGEAFYKAHEEGKYFNLDSDNLDEEDYHIADNISYGIERLADKVSILVSTEGADATIVDIAATNCNVSNNSLYNAVKNIVDIKYKEIREFVKLILNAYVYDAEMALDTVTSKQFIIECMKIYKKNNTSAENIIKVKEILDQWLNETSETYRKSNRAATLNDFRRALYMYFVMYIQINSVK